MKCLIVLLLLTSPLSAATIPPVFTEVIPKLQTIDVVWFGQCNGVYSGDKIRVNYKGENITVVVYGIKAPPRKTKWGEKACNYMLWRVLHRPVAIEPIRKDQDGRTVGRVFTGGIDVGAALVALGFATLDRQREIQDAGLATAEASAKENGVGMWQ